MKTYVTRILAGLLAAALPSLALAQAPAAAQDSGGSSLGTIGAGGDVVSDNLRLHTVQRKEFSDGGLHEVVLYPAIVQMNPKFTTHVGLGLQYLYHLHENFAVHAQGNYFYLNEQTSFQEELIGKGSLAPQAASSLTLKWTATAGFEVTPIYGKFAFYEGSMAHFSLVLAGAAGVGDTRIQLTANDAGGTFGDTGMKFVGQVGAGFRVRFDNDFVIRLQVNDLVYSARVDTISGCTLQQLTDEQCTGLVADTDRAVARTLLEDLSSDVLNNIGFYAGAAYTF